MNLLDLYVKTIGLVNIPVGQEYLLWNNGGGHIINPRYPITRYPCPRRCSCWARASWAWVRWAGGVGREAYYQPMLRA